MSKPPDRNDEVLAIFESQIPAAPPLTVEEPFAAPALVEVGATVRALTVLAGGAPLALIGIAAPSITPRAAGFLGYVARRARARRAAYLLLTSQRETVLVRTPRRDGDALDILRAYPSEHTILTSAADPLLPAERAVLADLALRVAADLATLHREGHLDLIVPDADFFVGRLTRAVDVLKPAVKQALQTKLGMDPRFAQELEGWATPQGIPADLRSPDFAEAVVRQAIYRLLGKIIFYQSLRRAIAGLPEMKLAGLDTSQVLPKLNACFAEAHKIDYHAVFREDVVDRLPYPAAASAELAALISDLNAGFRPPAARRGGCGLRAADPQACVRPVRTPESLVVDRGVLHPQVRRYRAGRNVARGTFLIRDYDRKRTALSPQHDHSRQLAQLWGVNVRPSPPSWRHFNLFRRRWACPAASRAS